MSEKETICVRILTENAKMDIAVARWWGWAARRFPEWDIDYFYSTAGPDQLRNECLREFADSDFDRLWMIDQSVVPPFSRELLQHDFPVLCGIVDNYKKEMGAWPEVFQRNEEGAYSLYMAPEWPEEKVIRAAAASSKCMVIKKSALMEVPEPYFQTVWDEKRGRLHADAYFGEKMGGVHVLTGFQCHRYAEISLAEVKEISMVAFQALANAREGRP